jgi:hypothetical protein
VKAPPSESVCCFERRDKNNFRDIFTTLLRCDAIWAMMMIETKLTSASADVKTLSVLRHEDEGCLL